MPTPNPDDKILRYNDVALRRSDLAILRSPSSFINDRLIDFHFARLSSSHPSASSGDPPLLLLLPPSLSFLLSHSPSLTQSAAPLTLHRRALILFTVNNNLDLTLAEGGTHWSLLVYHRRDNVFVHHDSCSGMNHLHALRLFDAVKGFFGGGPRFVEGRTPQQRNGYDCGVYVMMMGGVICDWFEDGKGEEGDWVGRLEVGVGEEAAGRFRREVLGLIVGLGGRE